MWATLSGKSVVEEKPRPADSSKLVKKEVISGDEGIKTIPLRRKDTLV